MEAKALNVYVLYGGSSLERTVSLASGEAVAAALAERGHFVRRVDTAEIEITADLFDRDAVVFNALHGQFGEDGQLQRLLNQFGVPYTGSGEVASRKGFSKTASKLSFIDAGVSTPDWIPIHQDDSTEQLWESFHCIGLPCVIKPDQQGSSLGVTICQTMDDVHRGLDLCFELDNEGLIETMISGSEWTVPLLDDEPLPLIKILPQTEFYDYAAKYEADDTGYQFDVDIPDEVRTSLIEAGIAAARAIGTRGIARVDLRLDEQFQPWVLEVNTSPGMTDHSLVPKAARQYGQSLGELCEAALGRARVD